MAITFEPPMIIDFHAHLHIPGTEKWAAMQHIDRSLLLAGLSNNEQLLEFCKKSEGRYVPYCFLDITDVKKAAEQARDFQRRGFKGVKFQPLTQRFLPQDKRLRPLWETLNELRMPITSHSGTVSFPHHVACYADPSGWSEVADDFPNIKIVIAHMGGEFHHQACIMAETFPNIYLDTAHLHFFCSRMLPKIQPIELVERAVRFAGAKKVLYGSEGMTPDFIFNSIEISTDDRKRIFWKNALEILGEKEI